MIEPFLMKLRARDAVSPQEEAALRAAIGEIHDYPSDRVIIRAGVDLTFSSLLLDGLLCRYKDLRNGERQITELHVAGDFADLHSFTLKRLDHNIMTLTPCRIALVPHEALRAITRDHPHLTRLCWKLTNIDAAIHREWVVSVGRRSALARVAHFFCEMRLRLGVTGQCDDHGYRLDLTQADLAECLGLTSVHINRMLRRLRVEGLMEFRGGRVTSRDWPRLEQVGEFEPDYLYLERRAI